jgi:GNAT superfamily N-acetyltransferase
VDAALRDAAEYPNSFVDLTPGQERVETERYTLCLERSLHAATVQRQRFGAGELDEVIEEVRGHLRARRRSRTQWEVGSAARPGDLVERLLACGLTRDDEPFALAMALRAAPRASTRAPAELRAGRVQTLRDYLAAHEVQWAAFGVPADRAADDRAALSDQWQTAPRLMHAVWQGERIIAAGTFAPTAHGLALFGGATHPDARGRGAYRALLAARWEEAARRGAPALLTQAGAMSRPILERVGFEAVGRVDMLVDEFG